jgi:hypothetical protein
LKSSQSFSESRNPYHSAGLSSGHVLYLFSGGASFESQPGHRLSGPSCLVAFFSPSTHFRIVSRVDHGHFHQILSYYVRFEVFTAVTMKNAFFWDVAPCRSCVKRHFGGTSVCSHLLKLVPRLRIFRPQRWRRYVPPKRRFTRSTWRHILEDDILPFVLIYQPSYHSTHYRIYTEIILKYSTIPNPRNSYAFCGSRSFGSLPVVFILSRLYLFHC